MPRERRKEARSRTATRRHFQDGPVIDLEEAPLVLPHDLGHAFAPGLYSINGGKMNGFNCVSLGDDLMGYSQHSREHAARLLGVRGSVRARGSLLHVDVRADVPRAPLHGRRAVLRHRRQQDDHRTWRATTATTTRRSRSGSRSRTSRTRTWRTIMALEEDITTDVPGQLIRIAAYWESTRTCIDIQVLPDKLERKGISWKYYANADSWMNALAGGGACAIRPHVGQGPAARDVPPGRARGMSSRPSPGSSHPRDIRTSTRDR